MIAKSGFGKILNITLIIFIIFLIFVFQEESKSGAIYGLQLCGNVLIPSLYPFTVCVLLLTKLGFSKIFAFFSKYIKLIFGLNAAEFSAFFLSFIGGYPIGARVLDELCENKLTEQARAQKILLYSVNAGPAFIVLALGGGLLGSRSLGAILLTSHITSSLIISLIIAPTLKSSSTAHNNASVTVSFADAFVKSASEAASTVFNICALVILFSSLTNIARSFNNIIFDIVSEILEVTTAASKLDNIYLLSFLLGFGGISVWLQVLFCCKSFKVKILCFAIWRVIHGIISVAITFLLLKIFKIDFYTISNHIDTNPVPLYKTPALAVSLIAMVILFLISLERKFDGRNLKRDLI